MTGGSDARPVYRTLSKDRSGLLHVENSTQRKSLQNIGKLFPKMCAQETMFAKAALGGKKFLEFGYPRPDTEFFNTVSPRRT
jgi:hypothetical protein